jgi:hypothetical protein
VRFVCGAGSDFEGAAGLLGASPLRFSARDEKSSGRVHRAERNFSKTLANYLENVHFAVHCKVYWNGRPIASLAQGNRHSRPGGTKMASKKQEHTKRKLNKGKKLEAKKPLTEPFVIIKYSNGSSAN